jgi:16S rRNA (guanine966-N2)-methyltransferase
MIRITGGEWRGRQIRVPAGIRTRPTSSKVRGALFDMLQGEIPGARFVDLHCGAGTMGIEALSRGAAQAVFVESDRRALALLRRNLEDLGVDPERSEVILHSALRWAESADAGGDVIFCDPPYRSCELGELLPQLAAHGKVSVGGWLAAEVAKSTDLADLKLPGLRQDRVRRHGDTALWLWRRDG